MLMKSTFNKYFTLEEAVCLLPEIVQLLEQARAELADVRDSLILSKRLAMAKQRDGHTLSPDEVALLQKKYTTFKQATEQWTQHFAARGILLRDLESGLLDFPYRSHTRQADYLLCWRSGEDGIFYFHDLREGFAGRHPISLLPQ